MQVKRIWASITAIALLALVSCSASSSPKFPATYDRQIEKAAETWTPGVDWRLYKAQFWQESRLRPDAVSPVGARGVAQFMPATWTEMAGLMNFKGSAHDPALAIPAGVRYMAMQRRMWRSERSEYDRHSLALCNYNAGAGNCLKAQKLCKGSITWAEVSACLPLVTGKHSRETLDYQHKIMHVWYPAMRF